MTTRVRVLYTLVNLSTKLLLFMKYCQKKKYGSFKLTIFCMPRSSLMDGITLTHVGCYFVYSLRLLTFFWWWFFLSLILEREKSPNRRHCKKKNESSSVKWRKNEHLYIETRDYLSLFLFYFSFFRINLYFYIFILYNSQNILIGYYLPLSPPPPFSFMCHEGGDSRDIFRIFEDF